jgi:hypothetical protein
MGYSVVTTVLSAAASYSLTDLATVKDEISIDTADTSNDAWLGRAIVNVSQAIASHTKRVFAPEQVQDVFDIQQDPYPYQTPGGFPQLELSRYPVLSVASVVQTLAPGNAALTPPTQAVTQALVQNTDFRLDPATGRLLRLNPFTGVGTTWEALPVTVVYAAGYGDQVSETHDVPASSPYQVTVAEADDFSCDLGVAYANGTALAAVPASPAQGQYAVDTETGVYTFNSADAGQLLTFDYATFVVPSDLEDVTLRLITARYSAKDRDPALIQDEQPGVGVRRYWFGGAPGQKGPFPPDIEAQLDAYRALVVV